MVLPVSPKILKFEENGQKSQKNHSHDHKRTKNKFSALSLISNQELESINEMKESSSAPSDQK